MSTAPRTVVFAYSEVGYRCLELLIDSGVIIVAVITHEDDPREVRWFRSVGDLARAHSLPVFTPAKIGAEEWEVKFRDDFRAELIFSFYYRDMIPVRVLNTARLGAFNMHGSYLPKYRGKAPVNWAVLHGADHIGATLHHMVGKVDAGDIVDQEKVAIGPRDTAGEVMARVTEVAFAVLRRQLPALLTGTAPRTPQDASQATYFGGRRPEDGRIDWARPAGEIFNLIRAVTRPYPGAFADISGRRLRVWWAEVVSGGGLPGQIVSEQPLVIATGSGRLQITESDWEAAPTSIS